MPLVELSDQEKIEIGHNAAKLAAKLESIKDEFAGIKKQYSQDIDEIQKELMKTLHMLY